MPLVYQQNINAFTRLGVWHIAEEEDFFLQRVPLQNTITHPHKRLQHLAGRILLTELFENFPLSLIRIADTKKPFLADEAYHFSISHCAVYAAAIVSKQNRVGVDIEIPHNKIERIQNKFIYEQDLKLLNEQCSMQLSRSLTLYWSAKESVFKWWGKGNVDFKNDIRLHTITGLPEQGVIQCDFKRELKLSIHYLFFNNNFLTWVLSNQ